ncbi:hypothetical protein DSCO28_65960 [Desulfosarcina ovata subsp. sediminis]|uniref:Serine protease n=1 Tax=Desulfosarcina ovata subsp. sediminis TaxID=885957 RepID=A0A5K8A131_9BACT|nr:serine protease [Desulfosarcina ovata]BBO86030.1 hypothetical protein DSCO28_65960 [Desulfosarcina ovata subsp. sediminis]
MKLPVVVLAVIVFGLSFHMSAYASEWETVVGQDDLGNMDTTAQENSSINSSTAINAEDRAKGVGLVVVAVPGHGPIPRGTAWLYKTDVLATNAHVALAVKDVLNVCEKEGVSGCVPYYLPNQSKGKFIQIVNFSIHSDYKKIGVDMNGKSPVNSPDVALMRLKEKLPFPLSVASKETLKNLNPGDAIQYIGFPTENLQGGNVNCNNVLATTQSGTISAVSDWWLGDSGPEANKVIRHDMGVTGGASGSPIFNKDGQVIGLVNAMNIVPIVKFTKSGKVNVIRTPNAAMVNYGIRVDLLENM